MSIIIFKILPILTLAALVAGVVFTAKGTTRNNRRLRLWGMGFIALFVLLLVAFVLLGLARL